MAINYYLDESGHSGDLIKSGRSLDFNGQPFFSLACVGVHDEDRLESEIARLRAKHQIESAELKSSSLTKKPGFIRDVVAFVCGEKLPFFIELVDKKFFICINIVNCHIAPPYAGFSHDYADTVVRNRFADYLYDHAPITVFEKFIAACVAPSDLTLCESFQALLSWNEYERDQSIEAEFMLKNLIDSFDGYEAMKEDTEDAYLKFLPLPDDSKHNKPIWMLPNLSSFCNVYARINLFHLGALTDVRIIHDEQLHLDEIIKSGKQSAEVVLNDGRVAYTPHSNFYFTQSAPLFFSNSERSCGVQLADVLAGFVMRYCKEIVTDSKAINPLLLSAYRMLTDHSIPSKGVGINLVVPTKFA